MALNDFEITALLTEWEKSEDEFEHSEDENDLDSNKVQNTFENVSNVEFIDINNLPIEIANINGDRALRSHNNVTSHFIPTISQSQTSSQGQAPSPNINPPIPANICISKVQQPQKPVNLKWKKVCHVPNVRDYWSDQLGFPPIYEAMSQKRFEQIRQFLHFNNNETMLPKDHINNDRLHKIRPLVDYLNAKFSSIPYRRDLALDEQLCATKARNYLKQYLPMKPHKWGYKLYVLSDSKGFSYKFEIYTGQENQERFRLQNEQDLGSSANVVIRLTREVPTNENYRVYFDNYYTSVPLMAALYHKGILSVGTVRRNRIPNCKLPDEKCFKKQIRGTSYEYITSYKGAPISNVIWKDNKLVTLMSTYCGVEPKSTIKRFEKKTKNKTTIECPFIIKEYNRFMGGVDTLDSLIGRNKIKMRSRKWFIRLWYHLLDLTTVNSWLLYKRTREELKEPIKYTLADWRKELAFCLTKTGVVRKSRGRPSLLEGELQNVKIRRPTTSTPKDVRQDMLGHWPRFQDKKGRCKIPYCTGTTFWMCSKCKQYLCQTKDKQCFENYHVA
ncbi:piggyBac transposable element-derived protein 2-like [Melanaphis sacchari]|uniref:piggyBac transposable element-derived protein 2-like n=1 Tax=Melanaphis sacchari TaxID=742174 RepID=UPI000DC13DE9|nr:piggyBac transposable element-derived protein 2-like [Melanaphis sacchari]